MDDTNDGADVVMNEDADSSVHSQCESPRELHTGPFMVVHSCTEAPDKVGIHIGNPKNCFNELFESIIDCKFDFVLSYSI